MTALWWGCCSGNGAGSEEASFAWDPHDDPIDDMKSTPDDSDARHPVRGMTDDADIRQDEDDGNGRGDGAPFLQELPHGDCHAPYRCAIHYDGYTSYTYTGYPEQEVDGARVSMTRLIALEFPLLHVADVVTLTQGTPR